MPLCPSITVAINGVDAIEEKKIFVVSCKNAHTRFFFYKEPTSRPSSKSSLFIDLKSANCSTKSSLIVP